MSRQTNLAKIHIAKKQLGMSDDAYRAMLKDVAKVESAKDLDFHGQYAVLQRLKELGFKQKPGKNKGRKAGKKKTQADKIRALWITMAQAGVIKDSGEAALGKFIHKQTNGLKQRPEFLTPVEANKVIEVLKKWAQRIGVDL